MLAIISKEFKSFLNSLIAYIVIIVFLTAMGLLVWVFPDTSVLNYGYADMSPLFNLGPYILMFLIPAITMRTFAEEKKAGTLELLMTRPVSDTQIILGKFIACLALVIMALLPTIIYYFSLVELGNPKGNIDTAGVMGSYIGLLLLSSVFTAVGMLASSLTDNQVVAFVMATFLCFLLFTGIDAASRLQFWRNYTSIIEWLGLQYHYQSLSKGLIDSRNVVYMLSILLVMLFLTALRLDSRKW